MSCLAMTGLFAFELKDGAYHVHPGDVIQSAIREASRNDSVKTVLVHPGVYRPQHQAQALIWFNEKHDGITVRALGEVTLTAANPELAQASDPSYPAWVNHVVYFGVGVTSNTVLEGFRITGANGFVSTRHTRLFEPSRTPPKNEYFFRDGGAVKVFGNSSPTLRNLAIEGNFTAPCGAGVSIQQEGYRDSPVLMENCVFKNNHTQVTGAAVDLLPGSYARIVNCLFVENFSNAGRDIVALRGDSDPFTNNGVVTVFLKSKAVVDRCTFVQNRNGVDDMGGESVYLNSVFWNNTLQKGLPGQSRFDLDLTLGGRVENCFFSGTNRDPKKAVDPAKNHVNAPNPDFDPQYNPRNPAYQGAGYRMQPDDHSP